MNEQIEKLRKQISDHAQEFCLDNHRLLGLQLQIETAMLIGASLALGMPLGVSPDSEDDSNLVDTPEGEEFLRQLFEGSSPREEAKLMRQMFGDPGERDV